ncbi:MAG: putative sugar O-methyltransferase [Bacteroidota bacterium]
MAGIATRIRNKVRREASLMKLLWQKRKINRSDPNYGLERVVEGFKDHKDPNFKSNPAFISRIIKSYNLAKKDQVGLDARFQVGDEWIGIYKQHMGKAMQALTDGDVNKVAAIYENFFRESCSVGLHGIGGDMTKRYYGNSISLKDKLVYISDVLHRYRMWRSLVGPHVPVDALETPLIGNPYGYKLDGKFIRATADYLHFYATQIGRLLSDESGRKAVMEIGGGFGGMAYFLVRDNPDISYVDVDLPENMALTAYYLMHAFPDKKILLYGEGEITREAIHNHDIVLLPNFSITSLPNQSANLVFNSYSLAEMSPGTIELYINEMMRITTSYFYHINHNKTSTVVADNFNVDLNKFYLMYKIPCLWNMGRNLEMDEYEYLYKKFSKG